MTSTLNMFQETQKRAAQKEKEQMQRVRENSGLRNPFGGGRYNEQLTVQQDAQMMEEINLQMSEEQTQAIRQLESDISDVNQIFIGLGAMVHDQGEAVDSIEASTEKTQVFVNMAANQLRQARSYQTKLRKRKCILTISLCVVFAVINSIIIWQVSN
jgi:t-SNARE complex subunit (syntaxin)